MVRRFLALGFVAAVIAPSPAFAVDHFAWMEVQRQMAQFHTERMYLQQTVIEQQRRMNKRYDDNGDRPLRGAKMLAGGPPKIVTVVRPVRLGPIKYKRKTQVGGIITHIGYGNAGQRNFGRILSNGDGASGGSFNFHGLSEGAKPFSFGLSR